MTTKYRFVVEVGRDESTSSRKESGQLPKEFGSKEAVRYGLACQLLKCIQSIEESELFIAELVQAMWLMTETSKIPKAEQPFIIKMYKAAEAYTTFIRDKIEKMSNES